MKDSKALLTGGDVHDNRIVTQTAIDLEAPVLKRWANSNGGIPKLIQHLQEVARERGVKRIVFAYEASSLGFGLYDTLTEAGIECHVLAPTKMKKSNKDRKNKTDAKDALRILMELKSFVFAGNKLPAVWVPDPQTRDDRELVRARLNLGKKISSVKAQIRSLLKRNGVEKSEDIGNTWTASYKTWLGNLSLGHQEGLGVGGQQGLLTHLRHLYFLEQEEHRLELKIEELSREDRYAASVERLVSEPGIGLLTAMVFLTEMGDMNRFKNRRQVGAYFGLAPSTFESGEKDDRKGHITREGSWRVRKVLCQCIWARIRCSPRDREAYDQLVFRNPKKKKIAVVAMMRRLSIRMWNLAKKAQGLNTGIGA